MMKNSLFLLLFVLLSYGYPTVILRLSYGKTLICATNPLLLTVKMMI